MKMVKASVFKARCLALMDEVAATGEEIVITKNGKPVSMLVPFSERAATLWGISTGVFEIHDDLLAPVGDAWDVDD